MYTIEIQANTNPDSNGWGDFLTLYDETMQVVYTCVCSTCPNPIQPSTGFNWRDAYGWISAGVYEVETIEHYKYGRSVLIAGGGAVRSRIGNVNHDFKKILTELLIHRGNRNSNNPKWRGSAGCPTIPPLQWSDFKEALPDGKGILIIKGGE